MAYSSLKVPFGLRDGQLFEPGQVVSGKDCNCFCPDPNCNKPLIANHPRISNRRSYFSHEPNMDGTTNDCSGVESAIHQMGKAVLSEGLKLHLPEYERSTGSSALSSSWYYTAETLKHVFEPVIYSNVVLEKEIFPGIRPDAQVSIEGYDKPLLIEIRVTHAVGKIKADKLRKAGFRAIEIDLSALTKKVIKGDLRLDRAEVVRQVHDSAKRIWLSEPELDQQLEDLIKAKQNEAQKKRLEEEARLEEDTKLREEGRKRAEAFKEKLRENEVNRESVSNVMDVMVGNTEAVTTTSNDSPEEGDLTNILPIMEKYLTFPFRRFMSSFSVNYTTWQMTILNQLLKEKVCLPWELSPWIYSLYTTKREGTPTKIIQDPNITASLVTSNQFRAVEAYLKRLSQAGIVYFSDSDTDYRANEVVLSIQSSSVIEEWINWNIKVNGESIFEDREFSKESFYQSCVVRQKEILYSASKLKAIPEQSGYVCGCCNLFFQSPVAEVCPYCSSATGYVSAVVTDQYYHYLGNALSLPSDRVALSVLKAPPDL